MHTLLVLLLLFGLAKCQDGGNLNETEFSNSTRVINVHVITVEGILTDLIKNLNTYFYNHSSFDSEVIYQIFFQKFHL